MPVAISRSRTLVVMLILSAVTIAVYLPAISNEFCELDDPQYVTGNPYVATGLSWANFKWALTHRHSAMWHPLTSLSHQLDVQLFGVHAAAHHAVNVVLHVISANLLLIALFRMTKSFWRSALVAAVFALHPLHVESVAWISERKEVLSGLFFMLILLSYTAYTNRPTVARYLLVLLLFTLGLLSKPMLVTVPALLLLLDYWPLDRLAWRAQWKRAVIEKLPMIPLALVVGLIAIWMQREANAFFPVKPIHRIGNAFLSYMRYVGDTFLPTRLCIFYPHPGFWPVSIVVPSIIAVVLSSVLLVLLRKRYPYLLIGWLFFLVSLLPVIGLLQVGVQAMADRYMYLPLIGIAIMFSFFLGEMSLRMRHLPLLAGVLLIALALQCWVQASYWRDSEQLFTRAMDISGDSAYMRSNLAGAMWLHGRRADAIEQREQVVRLKPYNAEARRLLANDYLESDQPRKALRELEVAQVLDPGNSQTYLLGARSLLALDQRPAAIDLLQEGVSHADNPTELREMLRKLQSKDESRSRSAPP